MGANETQIVDAETVKNSPPGVELSPEQCQKLAEVAFSHGAGNWNVSARGGTP